MKKIYFTVICYGMLLAGCMEKNSPLDFSSSVTAIGDTTYVLSAVPNTAPHQVLVEEFTGQSCPNCPNAHHDLDVISASHAGLINVVSMYTTGQPQSIPPPGAIYDFRNATATNILNTIYNGGGGGLPAAGIDRTFESASSSILQTGSGSWDGIIIPQLTVTDSLNLTVQSTYNSTTHVATITSVVTYAQSVSTPQNLSIYIVEDSIFDKQDFPDSVHNNYVFMDVFRDMVTAQPYGEPLAVSVGNNAKEPGRVFQRVYTYKLPANTPAINPLHCRVIAFVNNTNGTDQHIMQSAQCKFAP
jgi:hypothetical protein